MAEVRLVNIKKVYPFVSGEQKKKKKKADEPEKKKVNLQITDEGVVAVQEFNLDIKDKEFIVLVGPSGCGKSTTLRMVAGLEEISGGELYIDGKLMNLAIAIEVIHLELCVVGTGTDVYTQINAPEFSAIEFVAIQKDVVSLVAL